MAEMVVVDFAQKGQNWRKPNKMLKLRAVNTGCMEEGFFLTLWFCRNATLQWDLNELEQCSMGLDLSLSRAERCSIWQRGRHKAAASLRKRCYRSMGHTLVTPPNSFSTLSKQRLLCIYLHRELVLRNSIELQNSICVLIYRLVGESKWKVNLITQCVALEHVFLSIDSVLLEWTYHLT